MTPSKRFAVLPAWFEFVLTRLAITLAGLASATLPASAGLVQTKVFSATELNDGIHGGSGTPVEGTWTTVGATATYNLGLGANNPG